MTAQLLLTLVPRGILIDADRASPSWPQAAVLYDDDQWRVVDILAWCRYRQSWASLIRRPDGHEDWRRRDARYLVRSFEHLGSCG
ncbi:MAG: hypothetical protein ACRDRJ_09790 [Streptosporangiaceae bacterium]